LRKRIEYETAARTDRINVWAGGFRRLGVRRAFRS